MIPLDWAIVGASFLVPLLIGLWMRRRASRSMEDFFVAGRNLPWWIMGISAVATYTDAGLAPAVTMWVYQGGLLGNGVWWIPYLVWMPLSAVLWAKYWRRLRTVTTAEFLQRRYSGRAASLYRSVYAGFMSFGFIVVLMGYVSGWLSVALGPILGWSPGRLLVLVGLVTLLYTTLAGLYGVAYSAVYEFAVFLIGNFLFVPIAIHAMGGLGSVYAGVEHLRGPGAAEFFRVLPPTAELTGMTIFAFVVQGLFFAASPTGGEGFTAQKFMAARNEFHAQVGQLFNTALTLIVRVVPFLFLGMVAAATFPVGTQSEAGEIWAKLVALLAPAGLKGILVAGILTAYMSTISTEMNWGASYVVNDVYRRLLPGAAPRHYVLAGRVASVLLFALSGLVAYYFVKGMRAWFLFINSVIFAFVLPLSWLRFFWWRLNIFGEAAALIFGLPLGFLVWFPLGFSERPFWQGFLLLFGLGWLIIVTTTLLTRPEPPETLRDFYLTCRPPGLWAPVRRDVGHVQAEEIAVETRRDLRDCALGVVFSGGLILTVISLLARRYSLFAAALAVTLLAAWRFAASWASRGIFRELSSKGG